MITLNSIHEQQRSFLIRQQKNKYFAGNLACDGFTAEKLSKNGEAREVFDLLFSDPNYNGKFVVKKKEWWEASTARIRNCKKEYECLLSQYGIPKTNSDEDVFDNLRQYIFDGRDTNMYKMLAVPSSAAAEKISNIRMSNKADFYITPNMSKRDDTKKTSAFAYCNIVIDIDWHDTPKELSQEDFQELCEKLKNNFLHFMPTELLPNVLNKTGRGLQLWWRHEACYISLEWLVKMTTECIKRIVNDFLTEYPELEFFKVDDCIQTSPLHLVRLPYSFNTKGDVWSEVTLLHKNVPNINELYNLFKAASDRYELTPPKREWVDYKKINAEKKAKALLRKQKSSETNRKVPKGYENELRYRCDLIEYIVKNTINHVGYRNKLIYNYLYAAVQYNAFDVAVNKTFALNEKFSEPLKGYEITAVVNSLSNSEFFKKEQPYQILRRYKRETWTGFLKTVPNFDALYKSYSEMKRALIKERKKERKHNVAVCHWCEKAKRNEKIREMARKGCTQRDIAAAMNLCRKTVGSIIRNMQVYEEKAIEAVGIDMIFDTEMAA